MSVSSKYDPKIVEEKWYQYWMENEYFFSVPDERKAYTIVIPPPNVTGVLHMGHMLNNTIQDVLIRRARMLGFNACWVPGTDHASIATEAKVVAKLNEEGIKKSDLTRDEFLEHAWDWTHKHGGIILEQLKKLGASCDWHRTKFTMDPDLSESVIDVFIDLYNKDLIYRGYRMVNWDPQAKTTLSDEEVIYTEKQGKLYYVKYKIEDSEEFVTIATTRPETILGDTALCINPNDSRFLHLKGRQVIVPISNRVVPIIFDDYVDMEFGTGCLKITPAHDPNDKIIGEKHQLEVIDIFNDDATLNEFGLHFKGKDRFVVREEIVKELESLGHIEKIQDYTNKVGTSERTGAVIEPKVSIQWFLKMKELAEPALKAVMEDDVLLVPQKFKNTYRHWMENVRDWNISRQLWWGHRIPAFYYGDGQEDFVVAKTADEAIKKVEERTGKKYEINDLRQEEDALDTWFSSWLWPISVFDGIRNPDNKEINYYYPTQDLVTAPEILFFWVARMIIAGYEYRNEKPFSKVYLTGIVRDKLGRKMSKSLGNSPDPIQLMGKYGADGVRVGMLLTSPAGNDLPFDEELCEQGRNFANKIWNAFRLVQGWEVSNELPQPKYAEKANKWFQVKLAVTLASLEKSYQDYRISEALMTTYKFIWDDFSAWYLEIVKPDYQKPIDATTLNQTLRNFESILKILHPFMPFITEEIWQTIEERTKENALIVSSWPQVEEQENTLVEDFEFMQNVVSGIRSVRKDKSIAQKESLEVSIVNSESQTNYFDEVLVRLANLSRLEYIQDKLEGAISFRVKSNEYFIPLSAHLDVDVEIEKLNKELDYTRGFLLSVQKKLKNERFMAGAPEQVVKNERNKEADALAKIKVLEESIENLKS
ncbi:valine--tRNA ligase [Namhaeicola litoreus]|uniref:Valine--tRNA ligase n=1 Tax=Namhaeicola litoreus TaxID=1052145 RepID=A0ABW3Y619_9FLAO